MTSQLYVFDLYGTLVDYNSLRPQVYLLTPNASSLVDLWRLKQLQYSFMSSMIDFAPVSFTKTRVARPIGPAPMIKHDSSA